MNSMGKYPALFLFLLILISAASVVYEEYPKLSNNNKTTRWETSTREEALERTPTAITDNSTLPYSPNPLIEIDGKFKEVDFSEEYGGFITCPQWLDIRWKREASPNNTVFINFTVFINNTSYLNMILEEFSGSYFCTPEGVAVYGYYTREHSTIAFFTYNLTPLWRTEYEGSPVAYKNGSILLLGEKCLYMLNAKTGSLHDRKCVGEPISAFKFMGERLYIAAAHPKGMAHLYVFDNNGRREVEVINIPTFELVGMRMLLDVNERYVAVAYFLYPTDGTERNGVCVFTADDLRKIACREFEEWERPENVKLEGNIVYIKTTKGVKAYKILSLE
ncbi:hypothetical protein [Thermococcus sp. 21S7]|uniref:hypothetical protein n=1 Tax=Thermococcus sp. 21S7 TaxID=1638221 RepID=UPI00143C35A6|nr:hypothetical protein [Thermococcus sp. 21S7]NJE61418.1 hypothetical protein [Thermococcus sp. 21S7]